jgi:hypothetical protein
MSLGFMVCQSLFSLTPNKVVLSVDWHHKFDATNIPALNLFL